jgi:hypothetical protein
MVRGKETEYTDFVLRTHLPTLQKLGLNVVGAFHVIVGAGPRISHVITSPDSKSLQKALDTREFLTVTEGLQPYIVNYSSRILRDSGRVELTSYGIELGTWRFNQYYTMMPGSEKDYGDFLTREYFPVLLGKGIRIKAEWQGIIGSGPSRVLLEGVAQRIQDIADTLVSDEYRTLKRHLLEYVRQYSTRILAPTGRVEIAFILGEMTKAL